MDARSILIQVNLGADYYDLFSQACNAKVLKNLNRQPHKRTDKNDSFEPVLKISHFSKHETNNLPLLTGLGRYPPPRPN